MRRVLVMALVAVAAAGCASATPPRLQPTDELPAGRIVFQVRSGGGMEPSTIALARQPALTVYGDGRAFTVMESRTFTGAPAGLAQGTITPSTLRRLIGDALVSGLFRDGGTDFGEPRVTDLGGTALTFRPNGGRASTASAYALGFRGADSSLTDRQRRNRQALRELLKKLFDAVRPGRPGEYRPAAVDVTELRPTEASATPTPWPGPSLAGLLVPTRGPGPCGVLHGSAAVRVYTAARANSSTYWTVDGTRRQLVVRAVLPGEQGCRGY